MHTFNAHAATDITGFGILGHAQNLAKQQRNEVSFVIHNLPVLAKMAAVSKACGNMFGLMHGTCPETSGKKTCFLAGEPGSHAHPAGSLNECPVFSFLIVVWSSGKTGFVPFSGNLTMNSQQHRQIQQAALLVLWGFVLF